MDWTVYILKCSDGMLYTGITSNLERRIKEHNGNAGKGARYTWVRRPVVLVYKESAENRSLASKRELEIKSWTRERKLSLINMERVAQR